MPRPSRDALRVRTDLTGFVERTSVCVQRTRASCARPCGLSDRPAPRQTGTQDHKPDPKRRTCNLGTEGQSEAKCTYRLAASAVLLMLGPFALRRQRPRCPTGAARGIAPIPLSAQGCAVSGTQAEAADFSAQPKSAMPRACSLGYLSCTSKKGDSLGRRPSESSLVKGTLSVRPKDE